MPLFPNQVSFGLVVLLVLLTVTGAAFPVVLSFAKDEAGVLFRKRVSVLACNPEYVAGFSSVMFRYQAFVAFIG
jgi:hypothetical protein